MGVVVVTPDDVAMLLYGLCFGELLIFFDEIRCLEQEAERGARQASPAVTPCAGRRSARFRPATAVMINSVPVECLDTVLAC